MKIQIHNSTSFLIVLFLKLIFISPHNLLTAQTPKNGNDKIVKVAVRAHSGVEAAKDKWTATIDYLSHSIEGYTFEIVPLVTFDEMRVAVERKEVQFVLTNPTAYIDLNFRFDVSRIATLINGRNQNGFTQFGSIVFCRTDREDINTLQDVKGKSIMGVHPEAFGGWRMTYYELLNIGINPFEDCSNVLFSPNNTQEGVVLEVLKGGVDLGTVRTGILEKMAENGKIDLQHIKIIEPKTDDFPLAHTSRLYPEWPFASLKNTDALLEKKTAIALMQMGKNNPAAIQGGYTGWEVPLGYNQVFQLLKALKVSPFEDYGKISVTDFLMLYWYWFLMALLTIFGLVWLVIHISGLNKKLKEARSNLKQKVEDRTAELNQSNLKLNVEIKKSREAEEKFRLAFHSNPDGGLITRMRDGQIIEVNDAFSAIMGFGRDEVYDKTTPELNLWVNTEEPNQFVSDLKKTGSIQNQEMLLRTKSGKLINGLMSASIISINNETCIISILRDITEQKKAEEAQKESELRFRTLIEQSAESITLTNETGTIIAWNDSMAALTGIVSDEVIGQKIWDIQFRMGNKTDKNTEEYNVLKKSFIQFLEIGQMSFAGKQMERTLTTPHGEEKIIQGSIFPIKTANGFMLASISRDVTERKKVEEELRSSEERYRLLFNNLTISFSVIELINNKNDEIIDFKYLEINPSFAKTVGLKESDIKGKRGSDLAGDKDIVPFWIEKCSDVLKLNQPLSFEYHSKRIDKYFSTTIYGLDENRFAILFDDITDRKKSEEKIKELNNRFTKIASHISGGLYQFCMRPDGSSYLPYISGGSEELYGISADVLQKDASPAFAVVHPDDVEKAQKGIAESAANLTPWHSLVRHILPSGKQIWVEGDSTPEKLEDGSILWSGYIRDVSKNIMAQEKIKSSEANLKALINNREDYIWSLDRNYRYIAFNSTYAEMFYNHYKTACKTGLNSLDYLSEDEKTFWVDVCERAFTGEHVKFEYSYDLGKGMQYFQTSINPIYEEEEITGLSLISVDITDQVTSAQRFKALFEYAPVPLWEEDFSGVKKIIDGLKKRGVKNFHKYFDEHPEVLEKCIQSVKILEVNQHVLSLHEAEIKEELFAGLDQIFTDESTIGFTEELIAIAEGKSTAEFDSKVKTLKGNTRDIRLKWNVVPGHEKTLERIYISTEDITERKKTEKRIKESETRLRLAQIAGQIGIWSVNLRTGEQYLSEVAASFHGLPEGTYAKEDMFGMVPEEDLPILNRAFEKAVNEGEPFDVEHRIINKNTGKRTLVHARGKTTFNADGEAILLQGTALDITERKKAEEEIRLSRERLIRAQHIAKMGDYTWDVDTGEVTWSDSLFDLLKYDKNEVIDYAKVNAEIHHPEDLERVTQWLMDSVASGKDELPANEYRIIRKDRETIYIRTEGVFDRSGGTTKLFATLYDITEQKKANDEIKKYASIVAVSSDMMSVVDKNYRYISVNESYLRAYKLSKKRRIGFTVSDIFGEEFFKSKLKPQIDRCLAGENINFQEWIEFPAYGQKFMDINYFPYLDEKRNITGVVVNARDITQQKKAEQEIIKKNESLAALIDVSYKITASLNKEIALQEIIDNSVKLTNLDTGAIYSIEDNRLYMNAVMPSLPPDFPDEFRHANLDDHPHINLSAKTGEPVLIRDVDKETLSPAEQIIVEARKMKSLLYIPLLFEKRTTGMLILATQNRIRLFSEYEIDLYRTFAGQAALVIKNIELFKKVENSVEQLEQRVLERTAELSNANRELEEFAYSISHDLRAPLRSISGFSEIISRRYKDSLNDEAKQYFEFIEEAANNMSMLINDLLRFARLAKNDIQKEPIELGELIDNVLSDLHKDILIQKAIIELPEKFPVVFGNKSLLIQIFSNLLINALTYHKPERQPIIKITVVEESEKMVIRIQDNGIGIPKEYHKKIFNIFQRLHAQDEYPGTGIGLAIVKKAVKALGGNINLKSEVGKGTTFILIFEKQQK